MPPANQPNQIWGAAAPEGTTEWLTVPSGQTCEAKRIGMQGMVETGLLGDADSLTAVIDQKHVRRVRGGNGQPDGDEINLKSLVRDPESLKKIIMLVDRATPLIVVNPSVRLHFTDESDGTTKMIPVEERDESVIYTDQIGFEDKMYLFNFAMGGTRDVSRFLEQSNDAVAGVGHGKNVPPKAKRRSGVRGRR